MQRALRRIVRGRGAAERRLLREVAIGRVFPDVLLGEWKQAIPVASGRRLTLRDCAILMALFGREQTTTALESGRTATSVIARADEALQRLASRGLVVRRGHRWALSAALPIWNCRVTAIEAKLIRWQDALSQALTYRLFAHRSFVLLDGTQIKISAEVLRAFEAAGVGLLLRYPRHIVLEVDAADVMPEHCELLFAIDKLWHNGSRYFSRARSR